MLPPNLTPGFSLGPGCPPVVVDRQVSRTITKLNREPLPLRISGFPFGCLIVFVWLTFIPALLAEAAAKPVATDPFPDAGATVLRMIGALLLVIALFFGGVWFFRNWQRVLALKGKAPKLQVIEARSLGNRNSLYVVGYEQERLLLAASPNGVVLLSHLPGANPGEAAEAAAVDKTPPSFAQTLQKTLASRPS